jgi:hypothetical protein
MKTFDQTDADCVVYVYREGIASAVGHDLAIEVGDFTIDVDDEDGQVDGWFAADTLRVRHAMADGQPRPDKLSSKDKKKIDANIRKDVLEAKRYPAITFCSTTVFRSADAVHVEGTLSLHGVERVVELDGRIEDGATVLKGTLQQSDFGIKPYKALLGALKIKAEIAVEIRVPLVPEADSE